MSQELKIIKPENLHESIMCYISTNNVSIVEYDDMKEVILKMIRERYIFNMNRERLRDAMEDITYILSPEDDVNKDRVEKGLEYEYSDDDGDDSDDGIDDEEGAELLKRMMDPTFMQQMGNMMSSSISQNAPETPRVPEDLKEDVVSDENDDTKEEVVPEEKDDTKKDEVSEEKMK